MHQDHYFVGENTKDGILQAALEIFATLGYKKTSMADISERAGVSRPTLYTYFKNKEAILFAVTDGIHKSVLIKVRAALELHDSLEVRLESAFREWTRPYIDILFGLQFGQELIGASNTVGAKVSANALERFTKLLSDCLKRHQTNGDIDLSKINQKPQESARYLILCVNGLSAGKATEKVFERRVSVLVSGFIASIASTKLKASLKRG